VIFDVNNVIIIDHLPEGACVRLFWRRAACLCCAVQCRQRFTLL